MAVLEGATTNALADVDSTTKGLRVVSQPKDVVGAYSAGGVTGILPAALADDSFIWAMRNGPTTNTKRVYLTRLYLKAVARTVASVFTDVSFEVCRFSAAAMTGGAAMVVLNKKQAGGAVASACLAGSTEAGDIRIATTAALGVAGVTVDSNTSTLLYVPVISAVLPPAGAAFERSLENDAGFEHPFELAAGEGIGIRTVGAIPTGLTMNCHVQVSWSER